MYMSSPTSRWVGVVPFHTSATAKISPLAMSTTGVPVMPTVGEMSPHGSEEEGTGVPTLLDHKMAPVFAASA